eukprot:5891777-Alexandrium_andersonii.AAC.1
MTRNAPKREGVLRDQRVQRAEKEGNSTKAVRYRRTASVRPSRKGGSWDTRVFRATNSLA